jgi:hypothetical protein
VNAHVLALEARVREMGLRAPPPGQDLIGLFCECGCLGIVASTPAGYEQNDGAWLDGHRPT